MRLNPPEFHGSKADEDPMDFIGESYRVLMGVPLEDKAELVACQLKGVTKIWYEQWVHNRGQDASPSNVPS